MRFARSLPWVVLLACPSTYLLVASSTQFSNFAPHVVAPSYWYVVVLATGFLACLLVDRVPEVAYAGSVVLLCNIAGYAGAYYVGLYLIGGRELAGLGLNVIVQPAFVHGVVGGVLLVVGSVFGMLFRGMYR